MQGTALHHRIVRGNPGDTGSANECGWAFGPAILHSSIQARAWTPAQMQPPNPGTPNPGDGLHVTVESNAEISLSRASSNRKAITAKAISQKSAHLDRRAADRTAMS